MHKSSVSNLQYFLENDLGSLIGAYVVDLYKIEIVITPKSHFVKRIFGGSNCS